MRLIKTTIAFSKLTEHHSGRCRLVVQEGPFASIHPWSLWSGFQCQLHQDSLDFNVDSPLIVIRWSPPSFAFFGAPAHLRRQLALASASASFIGGFIKRFISSALIQYFTGLFLVKRLLSHLSTYLFFHLVSACSAWLSLSNFVQKLYLTFNRG